MQFSYSSVMLLYSPYRSGYRVCDRVQRFCKDFYLPIGIASFPGPGKAERAHCACSGSARCKGQGQKDARQPFACPPQPLLKSPLRWNTLRRIGYACFFPMPAPVIPDRACTSPGQVRIPCCPALLPQIQRDLHHGGGGMCPAPLQIAFSWYENLLQIFFFYIDAFFPQKCDTFFGKFIIFCTLIKITESYGSAHRSAVPFFRAKKHTALRL